MSLPATASPSPAPQPGPALPFAHYTLRPRERQLLAHGQPLRIGSRAFDLLHTLVLGQGQPVSAAALRQAAWPGQQVDDNNLRVQLSGLRKLLGPDAVVRDASGGWRLTLLPASNEPPAGLATARDAAGQLPALPTPLIGRLQEVEQAMAALRAHARLSFVGPAGVGKTLLALHCAAADPQARGEGVWWVDLAGLDLPTEQGAQAAPTGPEDNGSAVLRAVAQALQLKLGTSDGLNTLVQALAHRQMLLVLDNCEHRVEAVATLADALLQGAPQLRLLATSRRPLRCVDEVLLPIGPLSLPDEAGLAAARRSDALQLFEARAQRADPRFVLTESNVETVTDICRRLDGVALAINLAAARAPLLGVSGLRQYLHERLRLLNQRDQMLDGRHRSLMAALDWSHGLLSPAEQVLLRRLGAVAGSFDKHTAGALAAAPPLDTATGLQALQVLVEHSLVGPETLPQAAASPPPSASAASPASPPPLRYRLHETVRLYARHRLDASGEAAAVRASLAHHLLSVLRGPAGQPERAAGPLRAHLNEADHDNLAASVQGVTADGQFELALQLLIEAHPHLRVHGHHQEALRWGAQFLADVRTDQHPLLRARLHLAQATICWEASHIAAGVAHVQAAQRDLDTLDGLDAPQLRARAWRWAGILHLALRQHDVAARAFAQALQLDRSLGDKVGMATTLNNMGNLWIECGLHDEAQRVLEEALDINQGLGLTWGQAVSLENLGELAYVRGEPAAALAWWQQSLPLMRSLGHRYHEAAQLIYQAQALRRLAQPHAARDTLLQGLQIARHQRLQGLVADALVVAAGLAADDGRLQQSAVLLHLAVRQRGERVPAGPIVPDLAEITATTRQALSEADWLDARSDSSALNADTVAV